MKKIKNMKVFIRKNDTGEIRSEIWKDWDFNGYWWEDGNGSCDCNRDLFFNRINGVKIENESCGDDRFDVHIIDADTNEILYSEFDPPNDILHLRETHP